MSRFRFPIAILFITAIIGTSFLFYSNKKNTLDFSLNQYESQSSNSGKYSSPPAEFLPSTNETTPSESAFLEILPNDCQNECTSFSLEKEKERYCRNVCGLAVENNDVTLDAPYQESLERKDTAIRNRDLGACSDIVDANLRKSCEVRVTEDLLE